jgi:hypothetical protein
MNQFNYEKSYYLGGKWAKVIADRLNSLGVLCYANEVQIAKTQEEREYMTKFEKDIEFKNMPGCLESKSQSQNFTSDPKEFSRPSIFVDTLSGWYAKETKPLATVLISQVSKEILVVPTSTEPYWYSYTGYDRYRKIEETWLCCPKEHIRPFSDLVDWLLKRQERISPRT